MTILFNFMCDVNFLQGTLSGRNFSITDKFVVYPTEVRGLIEMRSMARVNGRKAWVHSSTLSFYGDYKYPRSP